MRRKHGDQARSAGTPGTARDWPYWAFFFNHVDGSLALAAQREALVASALSKRISALEAAVGVPLLTRHRRGVVPTPAGDYGATVALLAALNEAMRSGRSA